MSPAPRPRPQVLVYMQQRLAEPRAVFLCAGAQAGDRSRLALEQLEAGAPLAGVMALLTQRQLAHGPWPGPAAAAVEAALQGSNWAGAVGHVGSQYTSQGAAAAAAAAADDGSSSGGSSCSSSDGGEQLVVVVKRESDMSTVLVWLAPQCSIASLEREVEAREGWRPRRLTCFQAPDGCLHVLVGA
jgi:hypothetical protein